MQTTSATWKALLAGGSAWLEYRATIAGAVYTEISAPVINRALTQGGLTVGNAISATCNLSIRTDDTIPRSAQTVIEARLTDGTTTSEWLALGTYYIARRTKDPVTGLLTLECYDALLKANADAVFVAALVTAAGEPIVTVNGEALCYVASPFPMSMTAAAQLIAGALGVQIDARTTLQSGAAYVLQQPEDGATLRDLLSVIAEANGGNWIITPQNKLRLVPVISASGAASATENVIDVTGVVGGMNVGATYTITGLRCTDENDDTVMTGDETGIVVNVGASVPVMLDLAEWMIGYTYQAFALQGAIYDPAVELGDYVRAGANGEVKSVLYSETATVGTAYRGEISAPDAEELSDEYPYLWGAKKALQVAKAYAQKVTDALDDSLDQESIFNRLTNNGTAQGIYMDASGNLYINGTYIQSGVINANLLRAGMISDDSGENYWRLAGANSEFVTNKGIIGNFTISNGDLLWGSQAVGGTGAYIGKNGISYNTTLTDDPDTPQNLVKTEVFAQGIKMYWNNILRTIVEVCRSSGTGGFHVGTYDTQGNEHWPFQIWDDITQVIYLRFFARCLEDFYVNGNVVFLQNLRVDGNLTVKGTKNRVVGTEQYSDRLLYAYETPAPMFGDVGEGVIAEDGRCHVWIDPIFAQTIADGQYQVFLQAYGDGRCWVEERHPGCFVVEGTPGLAFGWEIKARQRDYDQRRLDVPIDEPEKDRNDYADMAAQYIERLNRGRMEA